MSASNAAGAFLLPGKQALGPLQTTASTGGSASITQPLSSLNGLAARLLGGIAAWSAAAQPSAAAAASQTSVDISSTAVQSSSNLAVNTASVAAHNMVTGDGQEPTSVLSLTEAGKQHIGQLVVSEVRHCMHDIF